MASIDSKPSRSINSSKQIVKPTCEQTSEMHALHDGTQLIKLT